MPRKYQRFLIDLAGKIGPPIFSGTLVFCATSARRLPGDASPRETRRRHGPLVKRLPPGNGFRRWWLSKAASSAYSCPEGRGTLQTPQDPYLWANRGDVLAKLGRKKEVKTSYQKALELNIQPNYARKQVRKKLKKLTIVN